MSDWLTFWNNDVDTSNMDTTLSSYVDLMNANKKLQMAKATTSVVESLTSLQNIELYEKERKNAKQAIENQVLAGQEQILKELSYNTDQTLVYAARGNVSIASPVISERMKKGSEEAGFDFAMLRANADIQKINADIQYHAKRRKTFQSALKNTFGALMTYGAYSSMGGTESLNQAVYGG